MRGILVLVALLYFIGITPAQAVISLADGCDYSPMDSVIICSQKPSTKPVNQKKSAPDVPPKMETGPGIVRSQKTGATARVSPKYAGQFQAYINELEAHGAVIHYMGGYRPGKCSPASLHPCGMALDVCQDSRGRVSGRKKCFLPVPKDIARIAERQGLFEGSLWCNSDYGHAQVIMTAKACSTKEIASRKMYKNKQGPDTMTASQESLYLP